MLDSFPRGLYNKTHASEWYEILDVRADGTVIHTNSEGGRDYETRGSLDVRADRITIRGFREDDCRYVPVHLGVHHYLVEESRLRQFCNQANFGHRPSNSPYQRYFRHSDEDPVIADPPRLPAAWAGLVLAVPVDGTVTRELGADGWTGWLKRVAIDPTKALRRYEVEIPPGSALRHGMEMVFSTGGFHYPFEVTRVGPTSCTIALDATSLAPGHPVDWPQPGARLSTRCPDEAHLRAHDPF